MNDPKKRRGISSGEANFSAAPLLSEENGSSEKRQEEESFFPFSPRDSGAESDIRTLTPREEQVLRLLSLGMSNQHMAEQLKIKLSTLRFHLRNIYQKIGCNTRSEAIVWAIKNLP